MKLTIVAAFAAVTTAGTVFAQEAPSGDAEAGEKVFRQCRSCHMITDAEGNDIQKGGKTGPNLYGVVGRTAGTYEDFRYSDDMVAAGEAGLVWNEADFVTYVQDATEFLRAYLDDSSARGKMT
ncbi:cytochrome c family protein, partial [Cribrihabitans sp. XS_ASV171]